MKKIFVALLASTGLLCSAGTARIDLISGDAGLRVVSTAAGVSGKNMNWLPPEKAKRMLYFQQRNSCDEWSTMKFSFAADRDTTVRITLRGPYLVTPQKKRLPAAVFYDELRIDGKPAPNGGFEPGENAGRRWNHLISDRGLAAAGNGVLQVTYDDAETFPLRVRAGQPVQIEVLHRDAGLREPGQDVTPLPLKTVANRAFADQTAGDGKGGWTDQGEQSLRGIVPQRSYGGMEFDIPASGNAVVTMDSPHDRTGVKTFTLTPGSEKKYAFLYLLHAAAWVASSGEKLGSATVQYTDGSESRFSVENGRNICDWWLMTPLPHARSVYLQNREEGRGGFLMTRFPLDAKPVKQVRFDTLGKGIWVIVGASLSSRDVSVQTKQRECRFTAPRWKRADMQQLDLVEGSALDLSGRKRFSPEKDGAMQIDRNGAITFRTQEGKPVRLIGFNAFPSLYRMKGASREEIHRTIDRCLEQAKRMGYDYFRTNFLLDRDPFQGAAADFEFNPEYLDRLDYLVAACRRYGLYIYGTTASYQLGRKEWNRPFQQRAELKTKTLFGVPARRAEWKTLIVKLLTHVNPYTGIAYKDDPAFLCFEFYNEQEISLQSLLRAPESFPAETLAFINAKFVRFLEKKYGKEEAAKRIYATTDKARGALKNLATEEGYETFVVPDDVGGRFSVLTAVGLLPIAVSGADIDKLMEGAAAGRKAALENDFAENDAMQYAAIRNILLRKGKTVEVLANYEPSLHYVSEWWKQLYGESEGKDQKGIFPASVDLTTDLHSMGQFIQDGNRILFETVLNVEKSREEIVINEEPVDLDGLNYLAGKNVDFVNKSAMNGTILAHTDGNVPNLMVKIPEQNEFYLGELFYFFEFACGVSGYLLGVNPFNQPGVESYKKNMFALLGKPGYEEEREKLMERL